MSEAEVMRVPSDQLSCPVADLDVKIVAPEVIELVPYEIAATHHCLPLAAQRKGSVMELYLDVHPVQGRRQQAGDFPQSHVSDFVTVLVVVVLEVVHIAHGEGKGSIGAFGSRDLIAQEFAEEAVDVEAGELVPVGGSPGLLKQLQLDELWVLELAVDLQKVAGECDAEIDAVPS